VPPQEEKPWTDFVQAQRPSGRFLIEGQPTVFFQRPVGEADPDGQAGLLPFPYNHPAHASTLDMGVLEDYNNRNFLSFGNNGQGYSPANVALGVYKRQPKKERGR
jgi:hypothetical protein